MRETQIRDIVNKQRLFFKTGLSLSSAYRTEQLRKLYNSVKKHEKDIYTALQKDLGKSSFEAFMTEIGMVLSEISYMTKNTARYAKRQYVKTPLSQFPARSFKKAIPYGNTLIISPWNYPILLCLSPLASSIAAGNTAVVKPSAYAPNSAEIIKLIIEECFSPNYIAVVTGGREENNALLDQKFDFIFFTGSQKVGREVLRKAANNLTPVVLELGGKSPCIVDETANLKLAARRIVFGKFLNLGQTCVAPDYIMCEKSVKDRLIDELIRQIEKQYGEQPLDGKYYGKIINEKHYSRLRALMDENKIIYGGEFDEDKLKISPTLMDNVSREDAVMREEIFGPLLPIMTYDNFEELTAELKELPKPLALYIFSIDRKHINKVINEFSYGGGCINDVIIHLASSEMGFGGVGESGMGSYHGKAGFDAFSHYKSIVDKKTWLDFPVRYQPYGNRLYEKILHIFIK